MNDPIQVAIGVADETHSEPIVFAMHDDGASFDPSYTRNDFIKSVAILRDLADMLEHKLALMTN